jgi:hypothetical protein
MQDTALDPSDVRGIRGRLVRLVIATVLGIAGSFMVARALPTRDHFPEESGFSQEGMQMEGADPTLMLVGAVPVGLATYSAIGAMAAHLSRRRVKRLPRAMLVQRR